MLESWADRLRASGGEAERLRAGEGVPAGGVPAGGPAPRRRRALKGGVGRGGRLGPPWRGPAAWEPKRAEPLPRPELSPSQTQRDASGGREAAAHPAPPARASDATPRGAMVSPASQPRSPLRLRAARFGPQVPSLVRPAPAFDCRELLGLSSFPSPFLFFDLSAPLSGSAPQGIALTLSFFFLFSAPSPILRLVSPLIHTPPLALLCPDLCLPLQDLPSPSRSQLLTRGRPLRVGCCSSLGSGLGS